MSPSNRFAYSLGSRIWSWILFWGIVARTTPIGQSVQSVSQSVTRPPSVPPLAASQLVERPDDGPAPPFLPAPPTARASAPRWP